MDLEELKRRAYARPLPGVDPLAAQAELETLRLEAAEAERPRVIPDVPDHHVSGYAAIALATVLAFAAATSVALQPAESLQVFERQPTILDQAAPTWIIEGKGVPESARWLAADRGWNVYGFLTENGNVCIMSYFDESAATACTSLAAFRADGIAQSSSLRPIDEIETLTVLWGPTGGARVYDVPLEEID